MSDILAPTQDPSKLRRIKALNRAGLAPAVVGPRPEAKWIKIHKLRVNDVYQRSLASRSISLIRRIITGWSWSKYHPPIVVQITPDTGSDDDTYEVLDGQHTATGAASHGGIYEILCLVVQAETLTDKAEAFVGLNTEKVHMTPLQIFWAQVAANDENALDVLQGVQQGGGKIIKRPPPYGDFAVGETLCVGRLVDMAKKGGPVYVKRVIETGVHAGLAPIGQPFILALNELLLKKGELRIEGSYEEVRYKISQAIRRHAVHDLLDAATRNRRQFGDTLGYNLALIIKQDIERHGTQ